MPNEWFYARDDQQVGPVSFDQLRQLVTTGGVRPSDHIWKEGLAAWLPASQVPGLFATAASAVGRAAPSAATPGAYSQNPVANASNPLAGVPPMGHSPVGIVVNVGGVASNLVRSRRPGGLSIWRSVLWAIDWKFERYLTPWLIRVLWVLVLIVAFLQFLRVTTNAVLLAFDSTSAAEATKTAPWEFQGEGGSNRRGPRSTSSEPGFAFRATMGVFIVLTYVAQAAIAIVTLRIIFETLVVLFNMAKTLKTIEGKLDTP